MIRQSLLLLLFLPLVVSAADTILWESGKNQYIKLVPSKVDNEHPVKLNSDEVRLSLSLLEVWNKKFWGEDELQPVFPLGMQRTLAYRLSEGLAEAKPNQDLIFVLAGSKKKGSFDFGGHVFIAGRAFYQDKRLNIILGDYARHRNKGEEAMAGAFGEYEIKYNFSHGSRKRKLINPYAFKENIVGVAGVGLHEQDGKKRLDWIRINVSEVAALAQQADSSQLVESEAIKREAQQLAQERREMRLEMARLRKQMKEQNPLTVKKRLQKLQNLRKENLITREEYEQKRLDILSEL